MEPAAVMGGCADSCSPAPRPWQEAIAVGAVNVKELRREILHIPDGMLTPWEFPATATLDSFKLSYGASRRPRRSEQGIGR